MSTEQKKGPWFLWQELAMQEEGYESDEIELELLEQESFDIYAGTPKEITRGRLVGCKQVAEIEAFDFDDDSKAALDVARLIASAPDLLVALEEAIAAVRVFHGPAEWETYRDHSPEMKRWTALIARAKGGAA